MKALILAAGYATRLYPLTLDIPKCLLSVGGKTILDSLCDKLNPLEGLDEIVVVTNAKFYEKIKAWKENARSRVPLRVIQDQSTSNETRLGAIGDLDFAIRTLSLKADLLTLASDNLFDSGLVDFVNFSKSKNGAVCIALHDIKNPRLAANKFGVHEINERNEVIGMEEKPQNPRSSLIGMGVYYLPAASLHFVSAYLSQKDAKDAPGYLIRWLFDKTKIFGFLFSGLWYDIGDLKSLTEADKIFKMRSS